MNDLILWAKKHYLWKSKITKWAYSGQFMTNFKIVQFGNLSVKKSDDKKLILESETFRIVIQTRWDNHVKIFLLTAFDLRKKPE